MLFNSYLFLLLFLPVALGGYYLLGRVRLRWAALWLCVVSFVFYGWWNPRFVVLLAASILFNYVVSLLIVRSAGQPRRQWWVVAIGIGCNLTLLFYYKYFATLLDVLQGWGLGHGKVEDILLPLGISFFTFTQIGYLLDCKAGAVKKPNLLNHTLFVTFFPHLIAGPVLHHKEMMPQFAEPENYRFKAENLSIGGTLFVIGLAKKVLLADTIAPYADNGFAAPGDLDFWGAWATSLSYAMQLYFDFSGYSDMALGLSKMFGIRFPLNFNSPFKAPSIIEYWARWHMTLTRYLTAYLYYPMAMRISRWRSRRGQPVGTAGSRTPAGFALMIALPTIYTMGLAGIWHGAGLQFFVYGLLHGSYLCVNHAWRVVVAGRIAPERAWTRWLWRSACVLLTFGAVMLAHAFFRAANVYDAIDLLRAMLGMQGFESADPSLDALRNADTLAAWHLLVSRHLHTVYLVLLLAIVWLAPNSHQILGRFSPALARPQEATPAFMRWRPNTQWLVVLLVLLFFCLANLHRESRFLLSVLMLPMPSLRARFCLAGSSLLFAASAVVAQEGALSQLYAARPPAGSSFVRVVNPLPALLRVRVADGPVQSIDASAPASSYAIVRGGRDFVVQVGGKPVATLQVRPDSFSTLVLRRESDGYAFTPIDDTTDTQDALKAELRFYNLASGCSAAELQLSPAGTTVFRDVAATTAAARSVNPVRAALAGRCGEAATAPLSLPPMQPGDHLSIFLTGTAAKPALSVQPSRTDPFKR